MLSSRVNYTPECEQLVNQAIQLHQSASLTYDHLAAACATEEVNMPGFCKFFRLCSLRTRKMSEYWINWQIMRGGKMVVSELKPLVPISDLWNQGIEKLIHWAVEVEKKLEEMMRSIIRTARSKEDYATAEYVERRFLVKQLMIIQMMVTNANGLRVSENAYLFDRETMMCQAKQIRCCLKWREQRMDNCDKEDRKGYKAWSSSVLAFTYPIV